MAVKCIVDGLRHTIQCLGKASYTGFAKRAAYKDLLAVTDVEVRSLSIHQVCLTFCFGKTTGGKTIEIFYSSIWLMVFLMVWSINF